MRIVGILIVLALSVLGFVLYSGYSNPEFTYQTQVVVDVPPERAWQVFNDPEKLPLWVEGFQKIEYLRGEPNAVGSHYRLTFDDVVVTEELTLIEENERLEMTFDNEMMTAENMVVFRPSDRGTRISTESTVRGNGIFWQSVLLFSQSAMQQRQQADLERFKALVERL